MRGFLKINGSSGGRKKGRKNGSDEVTSAIGIVRGLIGKVTVTDAKGSVRELRVGDAVELNDNVQASAGGTVHIVFNNGNFATVGSHDTLILSEAVIDPTGAKAQE